MSNIKENLVKAGIVIGGGILLYMALKPSKDNITSSNNNTAPPPAPKNAIGEATPKPTSENAEVVADAYTQALQAGETPSKLTELNQECMKEFGMRCYVDKEGKLVVCDVSGNAILTK
jgi:hypothetical protein